MEALLSVSTTCRNSPDFWSYWPSCSPDGAALSLLHAGSTEFFLFVPVALSAVDLSDIVAGQLGLICLPYFPWATGRHEICGEDHEYTGKFYAL